MVSGLFVTVQEVSLDKESIVATSKRPEGLGGGTIDSLSRLTFCILTNNPLTISHTPDANSMHGLGYTYVTMVATKGINDANWSKSEQTL